MYIKEFAEEVVRRIKESSERQEVTLVEAEKVNGIKQYGVGLRRENERVTSIIYLNVFFERFENGVMTVEEVAEQVIRDYKNLSAQIVLNGAEWLEREDLIDRISFKLVNREKNKRMIKNQNLVSYEVEDTDLSCLFFVKVPAGERHFGEVAVTEHILKRYLPAIADGKSLWREVEKMVQPQEIRLEPMTKFIDVLINEIVERHPVSQAKTDCIYVLSNDRMSAGAYVILTEAGRLAIAERFSSAQVTVLPSSRHELILFETVTNEDVESLEALIQQMNNTEVPKEDFLSNHVYHFDTRTGKLEIAHSVESEGETDENIY